MLTADVIMLEETAYSSDNHFQDALLVPRYFYPGMDIHGMSLFTYLNDDGKILNKQCIIRAIGMGVW